jgi:hypothetical protein
MQFNLVFLAVVLSTVSVFSAQTLQFNTAAGRGTRFATATAGDYGPLAGNDLGGLRWGIVVDTGGTNNGIVDFSGSGVGANDRYFAFSSPVTSNQILKDYLGNNTNDLFFAAANVSSDSSGFGTTGTGAGGPGTFGNLALTYTGISAGQKFALIWFNDNTAETGDVDKYGFFYDSSFILPSDSGGSTPMGGVFAGPETSDKLANITFAAVPEPSRMILLGFGLLGVFFRRRR